MTRKLSNWLTSYLKYTKDSESPDVFHFWTGVSVIAGALKRQVWIEMRQFQWVPNFYIVLVAPAGVVQKSTSIAYGMNLLKEVPDVFFGPDSGTWQAMAEKLVKAKTLVPLTPGNFEGPMEEMSCITCAPGELGTFIDFKDYKMVDVLTSLWDGRRGVFTHSTRSNGEIEIVNPWINIISATTPSWLKSNFPENAIGGGFASRVIFVFAKKKRKLVAYPAFQGVPDDEYYRMEKNLVEDLQDIARMVGEMALEPDAVEWGMEWYEKHNDLDLKPIHLANERFGGYLARKQTHMHKLAMILSAAESSRRVITKAHLQNAEKMVTAMEKDMVSVFESIGVAPTSKLMYEMLSFIWTYQKQQVPVTERLLWRHCVQFMKVQDYEEIVNASLKAGYLKIEPVGSEKIFKCLVDPEKLGVAKE